jgi:hypothetical protein
MTTEPLTRASYRSGPPAHSLRAACHLEFAIVASHIFFAQAAVEPRWQRTSQLEYGHK